MINIHIDTSGFEGLRDLEAILMEEARTANRNLAAMAHAHMVELATTELHSRRELFLNNLTLFEEDGVMVLQLDAKARWVDEGMCVAYGVSDKQMPSVLTPDGWVKLTDVKIGMLVLNQHNKWTQVLKIHDNSLFDYCEEVVDVEATAALRATMVKSKFDRRSGTGERSKKNDLVVMCPSCNRTRTTSAFKFTDGSGVSKCDVCVLRRELVAFKIKRQGFIRRLTLTANHPVFTARGEVRAGDLLPTDVLLSPAWGSCGWCKKKVAFGGNFCSPSCAVSHRHDKDLTAGTHVSQNPYWKSQYYKRMGANKVSSIEDVVAKLIVATGGSVCYFGDGEADWVRQFRVPSRKDSRGRQYYYFIDFYNPKLNLALEVDGKFHFTSEGLDRDSQRDRILAEQGISTVRVPVAAIKSGEFEHKTLPSLLANHSGDIELVPTNIMNLRKFRATKYFPMDRRWDITVADGASFVCNGVLIHNSPHNMLDSLLNSPKAKISKDGTSRYLVVPLDHSSGHGATNSTPAQLDLVGTVKREMKRKGIPWAKVERDDQGRPKIGRLHGFNIGSSPLKTAHAPGQGRGPVGDVMQGPNERQVVGGGPAGGGTPFLKGVGVYQNMVPGGGVKRSVMTFRVASSKHEGQDRWQHPGLEAREFFTRTEDWAVAEITNHIVPDLLERVVARL